MENRARVICHMMTTIDGKIETDWDGNEDYEPVDAEYSRLIFAYGQAIGGGRVTSQMINTCDQAACGKQINYPADSQIDIAKYMDSNGHYKDKIIFPEEGVTLAAAIDRYGKLRWTDRHWEYAGHKLLVLEVLTEQVKPEFLAYLDDKQIPYLFAGKTDFEPELFLKKLKELYKVDTFVITGGAQINAEFMRHGLVDEISLVIGPGVDGNRNALTFVGAEDTTGFPAFFKLKEIRQIGNNGVLLRYIK